MATIDPSIALGVKPLQLDNPMNTMAQFQQIKASQMQLDTLQRDRDALSKMQQVISEKGGPTDLGVAADEMIKSGVAHYVDMGLKLKEKMQNQQAFATLLGGSAPVAPTAPTTPTVQGGPTNALAPQSNTAPSVPANAMASMQARINQAYAIGTPQALAWAKAREEEMAPTSAVREFEYSQRTPGFEQFKTRQAAAGAARNIMSVNTMLPASEEAQKDFIKSTRQTYDALKQAPVALQNIDKAKALIPGAKGFMGQGGEPMLQAASFLNNRLGTNIDTKGVTDAQELRSRLFFGILDNLKKLDSQPSAQQQAALQEALGSIGTDPSALPRVLDAFGESIRTKVDLHNQEVGSAETRGVKFPYDPKIKLPEAVKPAGATPKLGSGQWEIVR